MSIFSIENISVSVDQKPIVHEFSLHIEPGEFHVLMGPNGSGKSSLAYALMGHPAYTIDRGTVALQGEPIEHLSPDKRAQKGLFLAFQHPSEIPGVTVFNFIKQAYVTRNQATMNHQEFEQRLFEAMDFLRIDRSFAYRGLNCGFSGGEKKRVELLQLLMLNPTIAILDEIDSGLDVDGIKIVAEALHSVRKNNPQMSALIITHYPRLLAYFNPDQVHIIAQGKHIKSGTRLLADEIEHKGYDGFIR